MIPVTAELTAWDHKVYYPGAHEVHLRLTADRQSQRVLGAQILGQWGSEVAKRIDVIATALYQDLRVDNLCDLDLSYTPCQHPTAQQSLGPCPAGGSSLDAKRPLASLLPMWHQFCFRFAVIIPIATYGHLS